MRHVLNWSTKISVFHILPLAVSFYKRFLVFSKMNFLCKKKNHSNIKKRRFRRFLTILLCLRIQEHLKSYALPSHRQPALRALSTASGQSPRDEGRSAP